MEYKMTLCKILSFEIHFDQSVSEIFHSADGWKIRSALKRANIIIRRDIDVHNDKVIVAAIEPSHGPGDVRRVTLFAQKYKAIKVVIRIEGDRECDTEAWQLVLQKDGTWRHEDIYERYSIETGTLTERLVKLGAQESLLKSDLVALELILSHYNK